MLDKVCLGAVDSLKALATEMDFLLPLLLRPVAMESVVLMAVKERICDDNRPRLKHIGLDFEVWGLTISSDWNKVRGYGTRLAVDCRRSKRVVAISG